MVTATVTEAEKENIMNIASYIDHTVLAANATQEKIEKLCAEAAQWHFASVCVNTCWTRFCAEKLKGTGVNVCVVVGFPLGAMCTKAKAYEAKCAVEDGADEVDMVINIGALKDGKDDLVEEQQVGLVGLAYAFKLLRQFLGDELLVGRHLAVGLVVWVLALANLQEVVAPVVSVEASVGRVHHANHIALFALGVEDKRAFVQFVDIDALVYVYGE